MSKIELNVLAKDLDNAVAVTQAAEGNVYVGVLTKNFDTVDEAVAQVKAYTAAGVRVSVGLGAGDPAMWRRVVDVSVATLPAHVNQVYPAAGLTVGALEVAGATDTWVNALITPGSKPGLVRVGTGPNSVGFDGEVSAEQAAALVAEVGIASVKFYPIGGTTQLDHLTAMVKAAVAAGVPIFEPTGGIDVENYDVVVSTCLEAGATHVVPHIYTSIVDKASGNTIPELVTLLNEKSAALLS
ncbi:KDGP aldolase [Tessaracoccus caeni]|uniref:KDGP aldolase n=1 Tax=Tessaracoccus caeni TaxID=3031239 RepID=UPI0023DA7192|nr:KDGP aldolase [Tessaracoccus caeni]MDF1489983.1 KDGP aldolase [Tessaracoccus caeni]